MISYLIDTDVCIIALKRFDLGLLKKLKAHQADIAVSDISLFELYWGAEKYTDPPTRLADIEGFADRMDIVPFDTQAARHAGNIRFALQRAGNLIGAYDTQIAGIARSRGLVMVTRNLREFKRVEGLRVENWIS